MFDEQIPQSAPVVVATKMTDFSAHSPTRSVEISPRRVKIYFQDDEVRRRCEQKVQQLFCSAMDASTDSSNSNSTLLAKKALKYRNVLDRMSGVDVTSPEFDASKFLGVDWCKTSSLKDHCRRQH